MINFIEFVDTPGLILPTNFSLRLVMNFYGIFMEVEINRDSVEINRDSVDINEIRLT